MTLAQIEEELSKLLELPKPSNKTRKQIKKLTEAKERWKTYDALDATDRDSGAAENDDDDDDDAAAPRRPRIGAQFVASSTAATNAASGGMGDGIDVATFSIRAGPTTLFNEARLALRTGHRYGFVGPNGKGKSTLLKYIAEHALNGVPSSVSVLLVEQEARASERSAVTTVLASDSRRASLLREEAELEARLDAAAADGEDQSAEVDAAALRLVEVYDELELVGRESAEARARSILTGLGFSFAMQEAPTTRLSGGWRMRLALATALFISPQLLLLDEPTNHLDIDAVIWLQRHLATSKGTLLVVSHDQDFLNAVATDIVLLDRCELLYFEGDYDTFKRRQAGVLAERRRKAEAEAKELGQLQASLAKGAENKASRRAARERVDALAKLPPPAKPYRVEFDFPAAERRLQGDLMTMEKVTFGYEGADAPLFRRLDFALSMSSRVALVGPNGCGKSTFMALIEGSATPTEGVVDQSSGRLRVGRFSQHFINDLPGGVSAVDHLHAIAGVRLERGSAAYQQVRKELGLKGLPSEAHELKIRELSGGQKARVAFGAIAAAKPHVLLLDEPTNHLDIESVDALIDGLNHFEGGVVVISHDRRLLRAASCELWECGAPKGGVSQVAGGFEGYEARVLARLEAREAAEAAHLARVAAARRKRRDAVKRSK